MQGLPGIEAWRSNFPVPVMFLDAVLLGQFINRSAVTSQ